MKKPPTEGKNQHAEERGCGPAGGEDETAVFDHVVYSVKSMGYRVQRVDPEDKAGRDGFSRFE